MEGSLHFLLQNTKLRRSGVKLQDRVEGREKKGEGEE